MNCKNCNEKLSGQSKFCSNCGQKNIDKLNLKYLFSEILDNLLDFDSKLFVTLKCLVLKPGFLSKEFNIGRRVRYVLPVKFYLVISVIFFFMVSLIRLLPESDPAEHAMDEQVGVAQFGTDSTQFQNSLTIGESDSLTNNRIIAFGEDSVSKEKFIELERNNNLDSYIKDSMGIDNAIYKYVVKRSLRTQYGDSSMEENMLNQLSIFLLLFIPFISLVYKWSFIDNKYSYVDHVVFNIHFNSFVILLLSFNELIKLTEITDWSGLLVVIGAVVYLYIAIKKFYNRKWWVALYKLFFLFSGYLSLAIVSGILLFLVSLLVT